MPDVNPIQPALNAVNELRVELKKRVGKEGGQLNQNMLGKLNTIEGVLLQIPSVQDMFSVINQQSQLITHTFRNMSRTLSQLEQKALPNGDNGTSETKGE